MKFRFSILASGLLFLILNSGVAFARAQDVFEEHGKHLPWTAEEIYALTSGYNQDFHLGPDTKYLLDFAKRHPDGRANQPDTANQPVRAIGDGLVRRVVPSGYNGGLGIHVYVNHGDGFETRYDHLGSATVTEGQVVQRGDRIGITGDTGFSLGVHIQVSLWKDGEIVKLEENPPERAPVQGTNVNTGESPIGDFDGKTNQFFLSDNVHNLPFNPILQAPVALDCSRVRLRWLNIDREREYRIFRNGVRIAILPADTREYIDSGLSGGTDYTYYVRAVNEFGGSNSSERDITTPDCVPGVLPPPAPVLQSAIPSDCRNVDMTWSNVAGETAYNIFRNGSRIAAVSINVTTYTDSTVLPESSYTYSVRAVNGGGDSPSSNSIVATTPACVFPPPPDPPPPSPIDGGEDTNEILLGNDLIAGQIDEPVNPTTGNFYFENTDLRVKSVGIPVAASRTYNSAEQREGALGKGWQFAYDVRLISTGSGRYAVKMEDGHADYFERSGETFTAVYPRTISELSLDGDQFVYETPQKIEYRFNASGKLEEIRDRNTNAMRFSYDDSARLESFTDTAGRTYRTSWTGNRLTRLTDPSGRSVEYTYDFDGMLISARNPRGGTWRYEYNALGKLMSIRNPMGIEMLRPEYDEETLKTVRVGHGNGSTVQVEYQPDRTVQTDERAGRIIFVHDTEGRLTQLLDQLGQSETYTYDAHDKIATYQDRNGNTTRFTYDDRGNITQVVRPNGYTQTISYNKFSRPLTISDFTGAVRFDYDARGNVIRKVDQLGHTTTFAHDARGLPTSTTDPLGHTMSFSYDAHGNLIRKTDALGNSTTFTYDGISRQTGMTDASGAAALLGYDLQDNVTSLIDPRGNSIRFNYDQNNNVTSKRNEAGNSMNMTYDPSDRLSSRSDYQGNITRFAYDLDQNLTSETDPLGNVTRHEYDLAGRRIATTLPEGGVVRYEYDSNDNVIRITDPNGNVTRFTYNSTNALTRIETPLGHQMTFTRDLLDRVTEIRDFNGNTRSFSYDALSRVSNERNLLGGNIQYSYDPVSNLLRVTNPLGEETNYTYDARNMPVTVRDAEGGTSRFSYDATGNLQTRTDQNGNVTRYEYDRNNNVINLLDAEGNTTLIEYDPRNLIIKMTDGNSHSRKFEYDENSRLIKKINGKGDPFTFSYDANGNLIQTRDEEGGTRSFQYDRNQRRTLERDPLSHEKHFSYDPAGNLLTFTDPRGASTSYSYDAQNRLVSTTDALAGITGISYDPNGNVIRVTDPLGRETSFAYNAANNRTSITNAEGNTARFRYNLISELTSRTDFRGNAYTFDYDGVSRMTQVTDPLSRVTQFDYDPVGNLMRKIDARESETVYGYDRVNRVTDIHRPEDVLEQFEYDAVGNVLKSIDGELGETKYTYDANDSLVAVTDPLGHATNFEYSKNLLRTKITDPLSHEINFEYDLDRRLTSITDPIGSVRQNSYDENDNLIRSVDGRGFEENYEYDPLNRLAQFTDEEGFSEQYGYDPVSNLVEKQNRRGFETHYEYSQVDRLTRMTDAKGNFDTYSYDPDGNLLAHTDRNSAITQYEYDAVSNLTRQINALDGVTTYEYDELNSLVSRVNPKDQQDQFAYDRLNRLITHINAASGEATFKYNKRSDRVSLKNPRGFETLFEYDADSSLVKKTDPMGFSELFEYDPAHNLTTHTDRRGNSTTYTYDPRDLLKTETNALDITKQYSYDENGNMVKMKDGRGNDWLYAYDPRNNLQAFTKPEGQVEKYGYDQNENLISKILPKGNAYTYSYDSLDLLETEKDPLEHVTRFAYDPVEQNILKTDAKEQSTAYEYDPLGRLTQVTDALGGLTQYSYDPVDNLMRVTDANGNATNFDYDVLNRLTLEKNPLGNEWNYDYDPNSNLASRVDAKGDSTAYVYDPNDRLTNINYPDATHNVLYTYDPNANLIGMQDRAGQSDFSYDAINRLTDQWDAKDHHLGFDYDENNNRTKIIYPNDKVFSYGYDKNNWQISATDWQNLQATFEYDDNGNLIEEIYPNDSKVTYAYDFDDRLTKKINSARGEPFETYELAYDEIHNITQEKRTYSQKRERGPVESANNTIIYAYDALSRLTAVSDTDGKVAEYQYDPVGNRLKEKNNRNFELIRNGKGTFNSNLPRIVNFEYNDANQLTNDSLFNYEYDENGNRTLKESRSLDTKNYEKDIYGYDFENRLTSLNHFEKSPNSLSYEYLYDGLGRRVQKGQVKQHGKPISVLSSNLLAMGNGQGHGQGGNPDPGSPADPGPPPQAGPPSDPGPPISPPGQSNESHGNSDNAPGQIDGSPGNQDQGNHGNDKQVGNAPDSPPGLVDNDHGHSQPHQRERGEERPAHPDHPENGRPDNSPFKPTWYVYDQFSFDPLAEFRFPNKEVHLRRVQTNGSPISKLYSREIFSGETPADPLPGDDPGQLGRYAYFYTDHRYDTSSVLKHSGQSLHSYLYDEYGMMYDNNKRPRDSSNFTQSHNFYTFSQKEFDPESSLLYFGARSYDAFSGTWTTQDIVRGEIFMPPTLHRYQYVLNNPVNRIDKDGFQSSLLPPDYEGIPFDVSGYDLSGIYQIPLNPDPLYGNVAGSTQRYPWSPENPLEPTISGDDLLSTPADNAKIYIDEATGNIEIIVEKQKNPKPGERLQKALQILTEIEELQRKFAFYNELVRFDKPPSQKELLADVRRLAALQQETHALQDDLEYLLQQLLNNNSTYSQKYLEDLLEAIKVVGRIADANRTTLYELQKNEIAAKAFYKQLRIIGSTVVDIAYIPGLLKGIQEGVTGEDLIAGEELSPLSRTIGIMLAVVDLKAFKNIDDLIVGFKFSKQSLSLFEQSLERLAKGGIESTVAKKAFFEEATAALKQLPSGASQEEIEGVFRESVESVEKRLTQQISSGWKNVKFINKNFLKQQGLDAEAIKIDFLGPKNIAHYDLYKQTETGEILIFRKGGVGEPIFTNIFIK